MRLKVKVWLYFRLEDFFGELAKFAEEMRQRFAICSDCGANRYTGKPCVNFEKEKTEEENSNE